MRSVFLTIGYLGSHNTPKCKSVCIKHIRLLGNLIIPLAHPFDYAQGRHNAIYRKYQITAIILRAFYILRQLHFLQLLN